MTDVQELTVDDFTLASGELLPRVTLAYATHGRLARTHDNAVLFPTAFGGRHPDNEWLIGPGRPLDTNRYFVIVPNQLGNGISSSPSNHPDRPGARFPRVSIADNVQLQTRLLNRLGIDRLALVLGFSMGGQQAYQWAVQHPQRVARLACVCSSARTSTWQRVFLDGIRAILELGLTHDLDSRPAAGRAWAGWGLSDRFYDEDTYRHLGHATATDFVKSYWVDRMCSFSIHDLLTMLQAWYDHDVSLVSPEADLGSALATVSCPTTLIVSSTDAYFRTKYAAEEAAYLTDARLVTMDSTWGHVAGRGVDPRDADTIESAIRALLTRP